MTDLNRAILNRLTQTLPAGNAVEQINAIVDRPDAEAMIQSIEPDVLYHMIKEAGWDQGVDLVPYVTPEQLQVCVDFDGWRRDRFIPARVAPWLMAVTAEASDERFKRVCRDLDPEVMAMFFKSQLKIWDMDEGRIPDEAPDQAVPSPDGVYALLYPEDEAMAGLMRGLLRRLYEVDRVLAWTLIEAVRWEIMTEMEESGLHWRVSRLEEYGYVSIDEAMRVYRPIDPVTFRTKLEREGSRAMLPEGRATLDLPSVVSSELDEDFLIVRVLMAMEDDAQVQARLFELMSLLNKAMIADGVEPGELMAGRQVIRRAMGYASLGLEFLAKTDAGRAQEIVNQVPIREIFRVGFSLVAKLRRQAQQLIHRPTVTLVQEDPYSLLNADDEALMEGLERQRPTYAKSATEHELYQHQAHIEDSAVRLSRIAFKQFWLFGVERQTVDGLVGILSQPELLSDPVSVTFETWLSTWIARLIIDGKKGGFEALTREELGQFLLALRDIPGDEGAQRAHFEETFSVYGAILPAPMAPIFEAWFLETLRELMSQIGTVQGGDEDAQFIQEAILLRS